MNSMPVCSSCIEEQGFPAPWPGTELFPEIPLLDAHFHSHVSLAGFFCSQCLSLLQISGCCSLSPRSWVLPGTPLPTQSPISCAAPWGSLPSQLLPGMLKHSWGARHGKGKKKRNVFSLRRVAGGQPGTGIVFLGHLCPGSPLHSVTGWKLFYQSQNGLYEHFVCSGPWLLQQVCPRNCCYCVGVRECALGCHRGHLTIRWTQNPMPEWFGSKRP